MAPRFAPSCWAVTSAHLRGLQRRAGKGSSSHDARSWCGTRSTSFGVCSLTPAFPGRGRTSDRTGVEGRGALRAKAPAPVPLTPSILGNGTVEEYVRGPFCDRIHYRPRPPPPPWESPLHSLHHGALLAQAMIGHRRSADSGNRSAIAAGPGMPDMPPRCRSSPPIPSDSGGILPPSPHTTYWG